MLDAKKPQAIITGLHLQNRKIPQTIRSARNSDYLYRRKGQLVNDPVGLPEGENKTAT